MQMRTEQDISVKNQNKTSNYNNTKNARKFEQLISDQTLEDLLRRNSAFRPDIPVKKIAKSGRVRTMRVGCTTYETMKL